MDLVRQVGFLLVCVAGVTVADVPAFQLNFLINAYLDLQRQIQNCTGTLLCELTTFNQGLFGNQVACIPKNKACDGNLDCTLGRDEVDCGIVTNCPSIRCQDRRNCAIPCNEQGTASECAGEEDEKTCPIFCECPAGSYRCEDCVTCVPRSGVCDGTNNCPGGDDELGCPNNCMCPDGNVRCGDGTTCVPKTQVCDGMMQCPGNDDDGHCPFSCQCQPNELICLTNNKCLPRAQICGGNANECCDGNAIQCAALGNEDFMCQPGMGAG